MLTNHIKGSGYLWLTLAKINITGRNKMEVIQADVDSRMLRMPTEDTVKDIVEELSKELVNILEEESARTRRCWSVHSLNDLQ